MEVSLGRRSANGYEFVSVDFRCDAGFSIVGGLDANHFPVTTNIHVAGSDHLLWKGQNKIDFRPIFKMCFRQKVQSSITHISCIGAQLRAAGVVSQDAHRQGHRKAPCFAPIRQIAHAGPLCQNWLESNIHRYKLQRVFETK
jgi:hypothetical protein